MDSELRVKLEPQREEQTGLCMELLSDPNSTRSGGHSNLYGQKSCSSRPALSIRNARKTPLPLICTDFVHFEVNRIDSLRNTPSSPPFHLLVLSLSSTHPIPMFERTLQDLIRGLRALKGQSKATEDAFLASALDEIRQELRGKDLALKADAVLKMCYVSVLFACLGS